MQEVDKALIEARQALCKKLMDDVVDSGLPYAEALSALSYVGTVLRDKGDVLLSRISIREVAKHPRHIEIRNKQEETTCC